MKVYLRHHERYWTGRIGAFKDGSNIFFVTTLNISQAKDLGSEDNALDQLEWWATRAGIDPKEWRLEFKQDETQEPRRFCQPIKNVTEFSNGAEFIITPEEVDGGWSITVEWTNPTHTYISPTGLFNENGELKKPTAWTLSKSDLMGRTLTEICKDADKYSDNSVELFNLMEEVKDCQLTESQKNFATDHINEKIEALKDRLRKLKAKRNFDEE